MINGVFGGDPENVDDLIRDALHRYAPRTALALERRRALEATEPPKMKDRFNKQYDSFHCISAVRIRAVGKPSRQRRKGPVVRFGGRVWP